MKQMGFVFAIAILLGACSAQPIAAPTLAPPTAVEVPTTAPLPSITPTVPLTPTLTRTPTNTPTLTLTPTITRTPTPAATLYGGSLGYAMLMVNVNLVMQNLNNPDEYFVLSSYDDILEKLKIDKISTLRVDSVSDHGDMVAFWNCATEYCDTKSGMLYLFTPDFKQTASVKVPGEPIFAGWSAKHDRLLYYLSSTMSDDFYLIKTGEQGFGDVIKLGRMNAVSWAPGGESLYAQKGSTVYHLDIQGKELETAECQFNNACIASVSSDGKRFAGIQKFIPTTQGNPVINITEWGFQTRKSVFIEDSKALILGVEWLPGDRQIAVIGQSARQRLRRFWRLDYLSVIDLESGEERRIEIPIADEVENFTYCGLTPDRTQMVYSSVGGRVKEQGRVLMSSRFNFYLPLGSDAPELTRLTGFDEAWESCPVWLEHLPGGILAMLPAGL